MFNQQQCILTLCCHVCMIMSTFCYTCIIEDISIIQIWDGKLPKFASATCVKFYLFAVVLFCIKEVEIQPEGSKYN